MLKINKKTGFTLLELLATIVILIIVIAIAVPLISSMVEYAKFSKYYSDEKQLVKLAKVYLVSNSNLYPMTGQVVRVTLDELKEYGLISSLKDANKPSQECDAYIEVRKKVNTYQYKSYLTCGTNYVTEGFGGLKLPIFTALGNGAIDYFRGGTSSTDGYVLVGDSNSTNKDLSGLNKGGNDAIIVRYDNSGNIIWKKNYGGTNLDYYHDAIEVNNGFVAVGQSVSDDDDLTGLNKGGNDGIIVKYDNNGNVVWKRNYGGTGADYFRNIAPAIDGFIVVGQSASSNGDLTGLNKGGSDAIIVKYDANGNVVWKKNYGGTNSEYAYNVMATSDGIIVVGSSRSTNGDLTGLNKGDYDSFILKYDNAGNIVWKKNYGGTGLDYFFGVVSVGDEYIATGYSNSSTGDLAGLNKGDYDAIIVKYDNNGNVVWKKNYGGSVSDYFYEICPSSDGNVIISGKSNSTNGDLTGLSKGDYDSLIVKYDINGNMIWNKNYGGSSGDSFETCVTSTSGIVAAGYSGSTGGDISGLNKGDSDAIAAKFDENGTIIWKKNYGGGPGTDYFENATYFGDNYVAAGYSNSTDNDFEGLNKGGYDAIIVKYDLSGKRVWQKNYGGSSSDYFYNVIPCDNGVIAVGYSNSTNADLSGLNKGGYDAIIVKFDTDGNVVWKQNYGGTGSDYFYSVVESSNGYAAVGYSASTNGDLTGLNKGGIDAIIVSFDGEGNIIWKQNYGGENSDQFRGIRFSNNEYIVAGYSNSTGGDLTGLSNGSYDGVVVKYDSVGNIIWKKNYGGTSSDYLYDITVLNSTSYVVGYSGSTDGDIAGLNKGGTDAILASFDPSGNIVWKENVGGAGSDYCYRIKTRNGQLYAVGKTNSTNDIFTNTSMGGYDAFLNKYDTAGNFLLSEVYGGNGDDSFAGLASIRDGLIFVGSSSSITDNFENKGSGYVDAIAVGYKDS